MTKFKVSQERESMDGADSTVDFEKQISNRLPWKDISNYELCNYVITWLLQNNLDGYQSDSSLPNREEPQIQRLLTWLVVA